MIGARSVLAVVPARGGSRGVPRKNLRLLAGRPLILHTLDAAHASRHVDRTVVSTEDDEILRVVRAHGGDAPFTRPADLARDETPTMAVVRHAIESLSARYDYTVVLQPTSPLRTAEDIDACLLRCERDDAPACVSVCPAVPHPAWVFSLGAGGRLVPVLGGDRPVRRQDLPPAFALNGAVYAARTGWLLATGSFLAPETVAHVMPRERSVDVDDETDLLVCEALLRPEAPGAR